jgi:hypothetical protein
MSLVNFIITTPNQVSDRVPITHASRPRRDQALSESFQLVTIRHAVPRSPVGRLWTLPEGKIKSKFRQILSF